MASKKSHTEFQDPGTDDGQQSASSDLSGYEEPNAEGAMEMEAVESEAEAFLSGVDSQLMAVKSELEKLLGSLSNEADGAQSQAAQDANITGVGIGLGDGESVGGSPAIPCWRCTRWSPSRAASCVPGWPRWPVSRRSPTATFRSRPCTPA